MRAAVSLLSFVAFTADVRAEAPPDFTSLPTDAALGALIREAIAAVPELREARARVLAEKQRVPQVGALPDPVLSLGIQNDGFERIQVGTMETSFFSIGVSQQLPWPGKRGLRARAAELGARQVAENVTRIELEVEGDVRRRYLDLLLARERLVLLDRLTELWKQSGSLAQSRYEVGSAPQSDILRAQLEGSRLEQRRFALQATMRASQEALNRLRNRPLDEPIATVANLRDLPDPAIGPVEQEVADAEARSPELRASRIGIRRSEAQIDLARSDRLPDFGVSAAIMPRGGLEPMWQVAVSVNLPFLWGRSARRAAITEARTASEADQRASEAIAQVLRLRIGERRALLAAVRETLRVYRDGLLVQSRATVDSTLAQYRVGRVTFASVLEALAGYIADEDAYLEAIVAAQRIAIERAEMSLDPVETSTSGGMATSGMAGAARAGATGPRAAAAAAGDEGAARPAGMGGM